MCRGVRDDVKEGEVRRRRCWGWVGRGWWVGGGGANRGRSAGKGGRRGGGEWRGWRGGGEAGELRVNLGWGVLPGLNGQKDIGFLAVRYEDGWGCVRRGGGERELVNYPRI